MCRFLIVDDNEAIRNLFKEVLSMQSYISYAVADGVEAIKKIEEVKQIRAVFIDIHLPGMDGLTLTRKLLRVDPLLYICTMTGYSNLFNINIRSVNWYCLLLLLRRHLL